MKWLRWYLPVVVAGLLAVVGNAIAGSGYQVNGTDLDSIFAPWHSGWPQAAATGFTVNGVDINTRYAPLSTGSAASATGYKVNGGTTDLNAIFAALGSTGVAVGTQPGSVSGSAAAGNPSGTVTSNTTSTAGSKGSGSYSYTWNLASGSGVSFTSPNGASTGVTGTVNAGSTASGSMYCTISDGTTTVNTNTVGWSLQNTTAPYLYNGTVISGEISTGSGSGEIRQFGWSIALFTGGTVMGSISPSADINGNAIAAVYGSETGSPTPSSYGTLLVISGSHPQNYFTTMKVDTKSFTSASATYSQPSGYTQWLWSGSNSSLAAILTSGDSHSVLIQ